MRPRQPIATGIYASLLHFLVSVIAEDGRGMQQLRRTRQVQTLDSHTALLYTADLLDRVGNRLQVRYTMETVTGLVVMFHDLPQSRSTDLLVKRLFKLGFEDTTTHPDRVLPGTTLPDFVMPGHQS